MKRQTGWDIKMALKITITNKETQATIERLSEELGISHPDIVTLAIKGKLPK